MVRLPAPPRFNLPPPPMFPSEFFDMNLVIRLTCSSIRQEHHDDQIPKSRLIAISCITALIIFLLFVILLIIIRIFHRRKSFSNDEHPSKSNPSTLNPSRSYETISSQHTAIYVESIDTSATTFSTEPSSIICHHCHQERDYSINSLPPYYHTLDILPS